MNTQAIEQYAAADIPGRWQYAESLAQAGNLLPQSMRDPQTGQFSPGRVYLIAETGNMLGIHPVAALSSINVIEGKPSMSADLMVALVRAAGHKVRVQESGTVEGGDYAVTTTVIRSDDPDAPFTSTWTPHRAARAGLCTYTQTDGVWKVTATSARGSALPWQSYTEALCKARSKSEAARDSSSDLLMGVRYTPEELGAPVDASGEVIEGEVVEAAAAPEPAKRTRRKPTNGAQGTKRKAAEPEDQSGVAPEDQHDNSKATGEPDAPTPVVAGEPIETGPMQGIVPTEAQVAAAEQMREAQARGTDTTVADAIATTPIPDYDAPAEDDAAASSMINEGRAAVLDDGAEGSVNEQTGEVEYESPAPEPEREAPMTADEVQRLIANAPNVPALRSVWKQMQAEGYGTPQWGSLVTHRRKTLEAIEQRKAPQQ